jgi:hypothetical protein
VLPVHFYFSHLSGSFCSFLWLSYPCIAVAMGTACKGNMYPVLLLERLLHAIPTSPKPIERYCRFIYSHRLVSTTVPLYRHAIQYAHIPIHGPSVYRYAQGLCPCPAQPFHAIAQVLFDLLKLEPVAVLKNCFVESVFCTTKGSLWC